MSGGGGGGAETARELIVSTQDSACRPTARGRLPSNISWAGWRLTLVEDEGRSLMSEDLMKPCLGSWGNIRPGP